MRTPEVIAEIGCNHMGDMTIAREMIDTVKIFCKVNTVKFQKRNIKEILTAEEYNSPHPEPYHAYGKTYGQHREFLEFSLRQHEELKRYCDSQGITYSCSVWDMTSLREIISMEPRFIKIPSAANTNYEMLDYICRNYRGGIHIAMGMTTKSEETAIISFLREKKRLGDAVIYACTSGYPVPPQDVCLLEVKRFAEEYGNEIQAVGFSGHHNGISIDVAAYTLGAVYIERHFTLDRTYKGTDHAASLEPDGLRRLNRDLLNVNLALHGKSKDILDIEVPQRKKLKWNRNGASD